MTYMVREYDEDGQHIVVIRIVCVSKNREYTLIEDSPNHFLFADTLLEAPTGTADSIIEARKVKRFWKVQQ